MGARLQLPLREHIHETQETDPLKFYYSFGLRSIFRKRLEMAVTLMGEQWYDQLLEVGFGSGIFLKELSTRCRQLHAIDIHENFHLVAAMLATEGVRARLVQCPVERIEFEDERFDCVVSASVLEHVRQLDPAIAEIARVLKRDGVAILAFPVENFLTDLALRVTYIPLRTRLKDEHVSDHRAILAAIRRQFVIIRDLRLPRFLPLNSCLYYVCKCAKR